jgi:hypothetical protein
MCYFIGFPAVVPVPLVPEGCALYLMVDLPVAAGPDFFWIAVFWVVASDEPCPPWFFGEGTFVVNDDFIVAIFFSYRDELSRQ